MYNEYRKKMRGINRKLSDEKLVNFLKDATPSNDPFSKIERESLREECERRDIDGYKLPTKFGDKDISEIDDKSLKSEIESSNDTIQRHLQDKKSIMPHTKGKRTVTRDMYKKELDSITSALESERYYLKCLKQEKKRRDGKIPSIPEIHEEKQDDAEKRLLGRKMKDVITGEAEFTDDIKDMYDKAAKKYGTAFEGRIDESKERDIHDQLNDSYVVDALSKKNLDADIDRIEDSLMRNRLLSPLREKAFERYKLWFATLNDTSYYEKYLRQLEKDKKAKKKQCKKAKEENKNFWNYEHQNAWLGNIEDNILNTQAKLKGEIYLGQKHTRKRQIIKDIEEITEYGVEKARERLEHNYDVHEEEKIKREAIFEKVAILLSQVQDVFYERV